MMTQQSGVFAPDLLRRPIGNPARAEVLTALLADRALTATELADVAGVTRQKIGAPSPGRSRLAWSRSRRRDLIATSGWPAMTSRVFTAACAASFSACFAASKVALARQPN